MPRAGDVIDGRYRLDEPIAEGGMGQVWRARHLELDAEVALKLMLPAAAGSPVAEQRFRREAQAAARLRSRHVVRVTDFGIAEGCPYLAMELLAGEDLESRLAARGRLGVEEIAKILDGVAVAIDLAHSNGVIHRDLKPANIFLAREGDEEIVKVLDFGIAKLEDAPMTGKTTGQGLVGSPAYMSPEQVWSEPITPRTDVWSLGVIAYEMLVGENPFVAPSLAKTFELIMRSELLRAREHRPELPPAIDDFLKRALAREPAERFESAGALARGLRESLDGFAESTSEPAASAPRRVVDSHAATLPAMTSERLVAAESLPVVESPRSGDAPRGPSRRYALPGVLALALAGAIGWFALRSPRNDDAIAQPAHAAPGSASPSDPPRASEPSPSETAPSPSSSTPLAPPSEPRASATSRASMPGPVRVAPLGARSLSPSAKPASTGEIDPRFGVPRDSH